MAAEAGNTALVQALVAAGASVNEQTLAHETALHRATAARHRYRCLRFGAVAVPFWVFWIDVWSRTGGLILERE